MEMINYFKLLEEDKDKSYEGLVFAQLARTLFVGSLDTSNPGKVQIQEPDGSFRVIVRDDNERAFINSTRMLYQLMKERLTRKQRERIHWSEDTIEEARQNLEILLEHLHDTGIFGRRSLTVVLDWRQFQNGNNQSQTE